MTHRGNQGALGIALRLLQSQCHGVLQLPSSQRKWDDEFRTWSTELEMEVGMSDGNEWNRDVQRLLNKIRIDQSEQWLNLIEWFDRSERLTRLIARSNEPRSDIFRYLGIFMSDNDVGPVHKELFGTMRISLVQNATSMEPDALTSLDSTRTLLATQDASDGDFPAANCDNLEKIHRGLGN